MAGALEEIERTFGVRVVRSTPAPWGSKNRTTVLELSDGSRLVLQEYSDRDTAAVRLHAAEQLADPLIAHGVPVPRVLVHQLAAERPWAVSEALPGEPAYVAAHHDLSSPSFVPIAREMGGLVGRFAALDPATFDLPTVWADPASLVTAATHWLTWMEPHLCAADVRSVQSVLDSVPELMRGPNVVCHGDFGPQNVLIVDDRVTGLLDLEDARIGDRLLDAAWWAWLVRAHTPEAFTRSWPAFLDASGVDRDDDLLDDRLVALIVVRLLETADSYRRSAPEKFASWGARISRTLEWRGRPLA